jgi:hypothetical protein
MSLATQVQLASEKEKLAKPQNFVETVQNKAGQSGSDNISSQVSDSKGVCVFMHNPCTKHGSF